MGSDTEATPRDAIVWTDEDRVGTVRAIVRAAGLRVVAAGSPRPERAGAVAAELGCDRRDDLRASLAQSSGEVVLIASPGRFGDVDDDADSDALHAASERGTSVFSLEPVPARLDAVGGGGLFRRVRERAAPVAVPRVPWPLSAPGIREGRALLETIGPPRAVAVTAGGPPAHGSAGARLTDAAGIVHALLGVPEHVEAAASPAGGGMDARVPHRTRGAVFSCVARYADGRVASLVASDSWGGDDLRVDAVTADGRVAMTAGGFDWFDRSGAIRDGHRAEDASWIGRAAAALRAGRAEPEAPRTTGAVFAIVEAALLSTKTGHAESPETVLRAIRH